MSECFVGEIRMFAGNYNPEGWVFCDGSMLSIAQNQALYTLIGTIYGGDGVTQFGIPDMRGRLPVGQGTGPSINPKTIGQKAGEETHTLVIAELPAHTHQVVATTALATGQTPSTTMIYGAVQPSGTVTGLYTQSLPPTNATVVQFDAKAVTSTGNNMPHDNVMVTTAISFIMATTGLFPSRPN